MYAKRLGVTLFSATVAETCCFPVDSVKVWQQTAKPPPGTRGLTLTKHYAKLIASGIRKGGGIRSLFHGVGLGIMRNALSTTVVMAGGKTSAAVKANKLFFALGAGPLASKIAMASTLSVCANSFLVPLETIKTRLQADARRPEHKRRYAGMLEAFWLYTARNGVTSLWVASFPTFLRSAMWWSASLPVYSGTKSLFIPYIGDSTTNHLLSSITSGIAGTLASHPADVVKTKLTNQSQANPIYRGATHALFRILRKEGPVGLFRGFVPRYVRLGPWQVIFFVVYEHMLSLVCGDSFKFD